MMFLHNFGNLMPPNRNENPGVIGINLARAVKHPAIAVMPESVEFANAGAYLIDSPFEKPPSFISASIFVKSYKLSYSISYAGASVSGSNILLPVKLGSYEIETLGERISDDYEFSQAFHSDSDSTDDDSLLFNWNSLGLPRWMRPDSKWAFTSTLGIRANANDAVSDSETNAANPVTGVTYTFLGEEIPLFARTTAALDIAGTVTVEIDELLRPLS